MERHLRAQKYFRKGQVMKDTSPQVENKLYELMRKKTSQERLNMAFSMYDLARSLVVAGIKQEYKNPSPAFLRRELFIRFYSRDFTEAQAKQILCYIDEYRGD
jgi:hypothetical protein